MRYQAVGIGIHTGNALRGYEIGRLARRRGAYVVFGGIHATLYPEEAASLGQAHAVVQGDGDIVWKSALQDCRRGVTQGVWDRFYSLRSIWWRSRFLKSVRGRLAFILISKIYRQMYANTGIATDSARIARSAFIARWLAKPCRLLFAGSPMPELRVPQA